MTVHIVCLNDAAGEKNNLGGLSDRRIPGTIYFTGIDASGSINASNGVSVSGANLNIADGLDIQPQGQMDIKPKITGSGIAGYELDISGGPAGDGGSGLAGGEGGALVVTGGSGGAASTGPGEVAGTGGLTQVTGGTGGTGSAAYPGGTGGNADINGGEGGADGGLGAGANGQVNIGGATTSKIVLGNAVDNPNVELAGSGYFKVGSSVYIKSDRISLSGAGSDPGSPVAGDFWYRTDTGALRYYDGAAGGAFTLLSTNSGILNPTRAANDLLQVGGDGSTWDAVGGAVGDPVLGTLYTENITVVGSTKHLLWNTDGGGNIGASGANRPDYIYAKTWVGAGASTVLKSDRISISGASSDPGSLVGGDIYYRTDTGKLKYYDGVGASSVTLLDSGYLLAGDVTGTPSATVVGDDTHYHNNSTLNGVPGAGIDTGVTNLRGYTVANSAPSYKNHLIYGASGWVPEAHYWNEVLSGTLTNASSLTLNSTYIDGNTQQVIKIYLYGYWETNGGDRNMYLRFNNDTGSNYGSYGHWQGYQYSVGNQHSVSASAWGAPGNNSMFGSNAWNCRCDVSCEIIIYPEVNNTRFRQAMSNFMWVEYGGTSTSSVKYDFMINWKNTANNITNIDLIFNGNGTASFYGTYRVIALVKK